MLYAEELLIARGEGRTALLTRTNITRAERGRGGERGTETETEQQKTRLDAHEAAHEDAHKNCHCWPLTNEEKGRQIYNFMYATHTTSFLHLRHSMCVKTDREEISPEAHLKIATFSRSEEGDILH